MPCRTYPEDYETGVSSFTHNQTKSELGKAVKKVNKLTAENDVLREVIIQVATDPTYVIPEDILTKVKVTQIKHRKDDLKRLEAVFRKNRDAERLGKVLLADPTKELEPQLGFDADAY